MTCFAARLKQLRNQRELTQTEVAAAIGVTRSMRMKCASQVRKSLLHWLGSTALQRTTYYVETVVSLWTFRG